MSFGVHLGQFVAKVNGSVLSGYQNEEIGKLGITYAGQITFTRQYFQLRPFSLAVKAAGFYSLGRGFDPDRTHAQIPRF